MPLQQDVIFISKFAKRRECILFELIQVPQDAKQITDSKQYWQLNFADFCVLIYAKPKPIWGALFNKDHQ